MMNDFDERLNRLESISEKLRNGEIPIDEATGLFEEGIALSRTLDRELQQMEKRIEILMNDPRDGDAPPELSLFEEEQTKEQEPETGKDSSEEEL